MGPEVYPACIIWIHEHLKWRLDADLRIQVSERARLRRDAEAVRRPPRVLRRVRRPGQESPPSRRYLVQGLGLLLDRLQQEGSEGGRTERHLQEHQRGRRVTLGREEEQREAGRVLHQPREKGLIPWRAAPACHRAETARKVSSEEHSVPWCSGSPSSSSSRPSPSPAPSSSTPPGATISGTASSPFCSPSSAPR